MILFWSIAITILIVTLAVILPNLTGIKWSRRNDKQNLATARESLNDLLARLEQGDIDKTFYEQKCSEIGVSLINGISNSRNDKTTSTSANWFAVLSTMVFGGCGIALYLLLGSPEMLNDIRSDQTISTQQKSGSVGDLITGLAERLASEPNDPEGWIMLGRSNFVLERYREARDAYAQAHVLIGDDVNLLADFAEASALSAGNRLEGEPEALIDRALNKDPTHQKALWLAGFADLQRGANVAAVEHWKILLELLPPESEQTRVIDDMIRQAQHSVASKTLIDSKKSADDDPSQPAFLVTVKLAPKLASQINGTETVFIYAKATSGPPMPLAIHRTTAAALPLEIRLDDTMSMLPDVKISNFAEVVLGARVSNSGLATPQSGDLRGYSAPMAVEKTKAVTVVIRDVVP